MDRVPQLELGYVEQLQRRRRFDTMTISYGADHFLHVVDTTFPGSPTRQDVSHGSREMAGHVLVQRSGEPHLLDSIPDRFRYPAALAVAQEHLIPAALHLAVAGQPKRQRDQPVIQERQVGLDAVVDW